MVVCVWLTECWASVHPLLRGLKNKDVITRPAEEGRLRQRGFGKPRLLGANALRYTLAVSGVGRNVGIVVQDSSQSI